jgi:hypothetical protein
VWVLHKFAPALQISQKRTKEQVQRARRQWELEMAETKVRGLEHGYYKQRNQFARVPLLEQAVFKLTPRLVVRTSFQKKMEFCPSMPFKTLCLATALAVFWT